MRFHILRNKLMTRSLTYLTFFLVLGFCPHTTVQADAGNIYAGRKHVDSQSIENRQIQFDRVLMLGAAGAAIHYVGFRYFDRAWYQGQKRGSIRWINDWSGDTYLNLDKGGHLMGGLFLSRTLSNAYAWAGFGSKSAATLGTLTSWITLLEIEMRDAYYAQWGFSIPDFTFNTIGVIIPLVHAASPTSQVVNFKFSYWPSQLYIDRNKRAQEPVRPHTHHVIDDYQGMTFWMTFSLREHIKNHVNIWPKWLGIAVGYSAIGLHGSNVKSKGRFREFKDLPNGKPEIIISFDYDMRYLPGEAPWQKHLKSLLNWIHFPAPAIRIYPDFRFYPLRW